jgi:hypothetical protein
MSPRDEEPTRPPRSSPIRSGCGGAALGRGRARTLSRIGRDQVPEDLPDDDGIVQRGDQAQPPPHWGHATTSMPKTLCMRAAQVQARGVNFTPASPRPAARSAVEPVGSGPNLPYTITRPRYRAHGANTPWQMSKLVPARGVAAASRSRNSSGSNTSSRVPSCQARLSSSATRPSSRRRNRPCAKGVARCSGTDAPPPRDRSPHPHVGVQVEAVQVRLPRPAPQHALRDALVPEAPPPTPRARPQRHPLCTDALTSPASNGDSSPSRSTGPVGSTASTRWEGARSSAGHHSPDTTGAPCTKTAPGTRARSPRTESAPRRARTRRTSGTPGTRAPRTAAGRPPSPASAAARRKTSKCAAMTWWSTVCSASRGR